MKMNFLSKLLGLNRNKQAIENKSIQVGNCSENQINKKEFVINCFDKTISSNLTEGYIFSLYTRNDLNDVKIFTNNSIGGNGFVGFVPIKYKEIIRNHLINTKSFFGNKTVIASLISKDNNLLNIGFELINQEEIRDLEFLELDQFIESRRIELNKTYKMKSSVEIEFLNFNFERIYEKFNVGFKSKEWYINNPFDYPIQLIDENGNVVVETHSQKSTVDRILKAHFNGTKLAITKKFIRNQRLILEVTPIFS